MEGKIRFGIIGCGAMGWTIAKAFDSGQINGLLVGVFDEDAKKADALSEMLKSRPPPHKSFKSLLKVSDFIIEAASQEAVRSYAVDVVKADKNILIMSVGALLDRKLQDELTTQAEWHQASIYLPSGALAGVDAVLAGACGRIDEIILTSTKPPNGFNGVGYVEKTCIDLKGLKEATVLYEGMASEAVRLFPKNINVSAVLSLASGHDVRVRIVADPKTDRNIHEVKVRGSFGEITCVTSNVPSPTNPKTSYLACLAAIAVLKKVTGSVKIGN